MCGITGLLQTNGKAVNTSDLAAMTSALYHRGPDDHGMHLFSFERNRSLAWRDDTSDRSPQQAFEGGFGFRRLSILDLSDSGHQPMQTDDGRVVLVFNGEIYNAFELRRELERDGCPFYSNTDTEVILRLYERFGWSRTLEMLNGMFAIAVADLNERCIYLARDRLGIKPLYWYRRNGQFMFASETKAFLQNPAFYSSIDAAAVDEQMLFRYNAADGFALEHVHQLEPGCWLRVGPDDFTIQRYWAIPDRQSMGSVPTGDAYERFESELRRSIRMQLLSDVRLGTQLSGGIDSSLVSVIAAENSDADLDAISIIFDDSKFSEEPWIEKAAARSRIDVHRYTMTADYFLDNLEKAAWSMDQPMNHPNALGIFFIAERAHDHVTVLLSGDGADELLGGYPRFAHAAFRPRVAALLPLLRRLPGLGRKIMRRFEVLPGLDLADWFIMGSAFMSPAHFQSLRPGSDISETVSRRRVLFDEGSGEAIENCLRYELRTYLVDLLMRQDKMSMAHSIENRVPFLDHELVEFVRELPASMNVGPSPGLRATNVRNTKMMLKTMSRKYFGDAFTYRPKSGFSLPLADYFRDTRFVERMEDSLLPGIASRGLLDAKTVKRWWNTIDSASSEVIESLWICVAFELWAQLHVDRVGASRP